MLEPGRTIRDAIGTTAIQASRVDHMLFTLSGNAPPDALKADLDAASADRNHYVVNLRVADHKDFIAVICSMRRSETIEELRTDGRPPRAKISAAACCIAEPLGR